MTIDSVSTWVTWFVSLIVTFVQWLSTMKIAGVSVIAIIVSVSIACILIRAIIYRS